MTKSPTLLQMVHGSAAALDPGRFRVFAERRLEWSRGTAHLRIIGESSLVVVETPAGAWFELIMCGGPGPPEEPGATHVRLEARRASVASLASAIPGCAYTARLWTQPLGASPFREALPHSLEFEFKGPGEPVTRIELAETDSGMRLRTRHDYPEEQLAVWSESDWRF